jgi:ABC-type thiamin/hydroxymethylpyrimidine transport system permease subunit
MLTEFKKGVHLTKEDKASRTESYLTYLHNRSESKACQIGIISGIASTWVFLTRTKMPRFPRIIYSLNLFTATFVFVYEMVNRMYTDRETAFELESEILKI